MPLACLSEVARPSSAYQPRSPAESALFQVVRDHLETFRTHAARVCEGERLPRFIEEEFEGFQRCLKKEAKALLRGRADWQLADAQHALAREYGFESWPKLKAHVEALSAIVSPFVGRWQANLERSKRHPANLFQRATLEFSVDGDTLTIVHDAIDEFGRADRGANTLKVDAAEIPFDFGRRGTVRMVNPHRVELKTTFAGLESRWAEYEVSADGKTLTVTTAHQHLVFDRV